MRRRQWISGLAICVMVLSSVMIFSACGEKEEDAPIVHPIKITLSIDYPDVKTDDAESDAPKANDIENVDFKVEEGTTVFDAVQLYCSANDIPITVETTDLSVEGINDILNGSVEGKETYTWKYKVNGKFIDASAGETVLEKGDTLEWVYTE